jgi:chromosome segregation protein
VRGLLGGELHVPERLRLAIGAALGERAQALVVTGLDAASAAVRFLRDRDADRTGILVTGDHAQSAASRDGNGNGGDGNGSGRCGADPDSMQRLPSWTPFAGARFISSDAVVSSAAAAAAEAGPNPESEPIAPSAAAASTALDGLDVLGVASDLVQPDPDLGDAAQRVLGSTVIVPNVEVAREAAARLGADASIPVGWQIATLDGVLIRSTGEWWAGRDRQTERLVRRRAELEAAEQELGAVQASLAETEQRLAEAEKRVSELAGQERGVRDALAAAEAADRKAALDAQAAAAHASRLERELRDAHAAGPSLAAELQRTVAQRERAEAQRQQAEQRRLEGIEALRQAEATVRTLSGSLAESRAARATLQADLARCRAEAQGAEALLARLGGDLTAARRSVAERERRVENERNRRADLGTAAGELRAAQREAEAAIEPILAALTAAREARQQARTRREAIEQRAAELRAVARSGRPVLEATAIAESRAADRLERVRREAQEYVDDLAGADGSVQLRLNLDGDEDETAADPEALARQEEEETGPPFDPDAARRRMGALRRELRAIGDVGEATLTEFRELSERHQFLVTQVADLEQAGEELRRVMDELTVLMRDAFDTAFANVNLAFGEYFARLFAGGTAELVLSRPDDVLESGVDIVARPPGKRLQPLVSLSGGERALTMVALIFALLKTNPAPFCVLDEVDAALDESNVRRFTSVLSELSDRTQFVVVSHNRATMEAARALYGISMDTVGVSTVVSLKLPAEESASEPAHATNGTATS